MLRAERLRQVPEQFSSALLDRLLHHAETVRIEGKSYRSKDKVEL